MFIDAMNRYHHNPGMRKKDAKAARMTQLFICYYVIFFCRMLTFANEKSDQAYQELMNAYFSYSHRGKLEKNGAGHLLSNVQQSVEEKWLPSFTLLLHRPYFKE